MPTEWINALLGGILIGTSVSLMLLWNGRVTGISGIINGVLTPAKGDTLWRATFVAGLIFGGIVLHQLNPAIFTNTHNVETGVIIVAGLLVGFGTIMGSGCTSGHGVCGISRMSIRSLLATGSFMIAGIAAVYAARMLGVIP